MASISTGMAHKTKCSKLIFVSLYMALLVVPRPIAAQSVPADARWITALSAQAHASQVLSFHKVIRIDTLPASYPVHVSADNRFQLYVNGQRVGEGPARGDRTHWRYESFDLRPFLRAGDNVIAARVWNFGDQAPGAQISVRTGFLLWGDSEISAIADTNATWSAHREPGWQVTHEPALGVGPGEIVDAKSVDEQWNGLPVSGNWEPAVPLSAPVLAKDKPESGGDSVWHLVPDQLPQMEYTTTSAGHMIRVSGLKEDAFRGQRVEVPAHTHAVILFDRDTLTTAYPELTVGAGAGSRIRLTYAEALVDEKGSKGNRNEVAGKHLDRSMIHDEFLPDGAARRSFSPLWWRTWRFLQIDVDTKEQPLSLLGIIAHFTAYPFHENATFHADDPELAKIWEVGWRTLRLNAHETHMDCPFWEQLQYIGDTRVELLIDYVVSGDDRLAEQALENIANSVRPDGLTQSAYPARGNPASNQVIPPFSLIWIDMLHDYWWYRPKTELPAKLLPLSRSVLAWFISHQRPDGLLVKMPQRGVAFWNFVDWSFGYIGNSPEDNDGGSVVETLQFLAALRDAAELEDAVGDPARAKSYRENATRVAEAVYRTSWDESRQLLDDTPKRERSSQHANILGVMLDVIPKEKQQQVLKTILADELAGKPAFPASQNLTAASYYFRFYLARAVDHAGMGDDYLKLLGPWKGMLNLGLSTWAETPEPTRSDAHAWSAHPNYDLLTIVAGIRPDAPGFRRVRIAPHLEGLSTLDASMPHGDEKIAVSYRRKQGEVAAEITLPGDLTGVFVWKDKELPLHSGRQTITLPDEQISLSTAK